MKSPRIYLYKVTFEEIPDFYWGIHKEKSYEDGYLGSPVTHAWKWDFYTPHLEICEIFPTTDEGWAEAVKVEARVIRPDLNNPLCLNERCSNVYSLEILRKSGAKVAAILSQEKDERGKCKHFVEMGKKSGMVNKEQMRLRGKKVIQAVNEKIHSERDENGKSLHALRLNDALHQEKDDEGKSLHSLKLHTEKDENGKSLHAKRMAEARWGKRK
jgi:hypothetical protein